MKEVMTEPPLFKQYVETSQRQIDDTVNVMRQNIQRTEERGGRVADLDHQTRKLADSSADFKRGTNRVRKQLMWKNVRMWVWILVGIAVLIIIIALSVHFGKK
ncbi:MAG: hypothetical protein Q9224_002708 [Gallowayella concinna]